MSTIMKALRKVEDQKKTEAHASQPGELDRQIVEDAELPQRNSPKRVAVFVGAVVLSGLAGVGITLGALSLWQTKDDGLAIASEAPAQIAAGEAEVVAAPEEHSEGTTVVVAQDVLNRNNIRDNKDNTNKDKNKDKNKDNPNQNNIGGGGIEIVAGSENGKDVIVVNAASASAATGDAAAKTAPVAEPFPTDTIEAPAVIERLKGSREARFSRMPGKAAQATTEAPSGEEPITKVAKVTTDAIPAHAPVMAVNIPDETTDTAVREEVAAVQAHVGSSVISKPDEQTIDGDVSRDSQRNVVESSANTLVEAAVEVEEGIGDNLLSSASRLPDENTKAGPRFVIRGTTWHPYRQRRTADISVKTAGGTQTVEVREGEMLGSMKVSEIGPTSITFLHEGKVIKRRIGSGLH